MKRTTIFYVVGAFFAVLLAACSDNEGTPTLAPTVAMPENAGTTAVFTETNNGAANTPSALPTNTAVPPTPTPTVPLAALVNGQPITLAAYEKELARYEQALQPGTTTEASYREVVLNALIEQVLMEQAASAGGIQVTAERVAQEIESLRAEGDLAAWLAANLYTEEEFYEAVRLGILAEEMIAVVTANVPQTAEQLHAQYIHVNDAVQADELRTRIQNGDDFAFLADQFSLEPGNGGDMGWFARGSLTVPELEEPTFALPNPNDVTAVIPVGQADGTTTYYIVQLLERDPARPLDVNMRIPLLEAARAEWLAGLWENATIERFVDTGS